MSSRAPLTILLACSIAACGKQPLPPPGAAPAEPLYWLAMIEHRPHPDDAAALNPRIVYQMRLLEFGEAALRRLRQAANEPNGEAAAAMSETMRSLARGMNLHPNPEARLAGGKMVLWERDLPSLIAAMEEEAGARLIAHPSTIASEGENIIFDIRRRPDRGAASASDRDQWNGVEMTIQPPKILPRGGMSILGFPLRFHEDGEERSGRAPGMLILPGPNSSGREHLSQTYGLLVPAPPGEGPLSLEVTPRRGSGSRRPIG